MHAHDIVDIHVGRRRRPRPIRSRWPTRPVDHVERARARQSEGRRADAGVRHESATTGPASTRSGSSTLRSVTARTAELGGVSDTGGKTEVLGNSFVGSTNCAKYGGPYCIYPWFSWDGA